MKLVFRGHQAFEILASRRLTARRISRRTRRTFVRGGGTVGSILMMGHERRPSY